MKRKLKFCCISLICFLLSIFTILKSNQPTNHSTHTIEIPLINQYPLLPTGCEAVAATMVLQYYDVNIEPTQFASEWLNCSENFYYIGNNLYGPNPNKVFVGNPFSRNSYGCYADVIVKAINYNTNQCKAVKLIDKTLEELCQTYIDYQQPILIWATMSMKAPQEGTFWILEDGSPFTWIAGEHCLVLIGYDENNYYLADPQKGKVVSFEKSLVEKRYQQLGCQSVYIYPN